MTRRPLQRQPSLFDTAPYSAPKNRRKTAVERRNEMLAKVEASEAAAGDFLSAAIEAIRGLPPETYTGEGIRVLLEAQGIKPTHSNAWGMATMRAVRDGLLVPTGRYVPTVRETSHARKTPEYEIQPWRRAEGCSIWNGPGENNRRRSREKTAEADLYRGAKVMKQKPDSVIQWETHHRFCFLCGADAKKSKHGAGLVTHHIQRRGTCYQPFRDKWDNLVRLCWIMCHAEVESWPHAKQLALKWLKDDMLREEHNGSLQSFIDEWLKCRDGGLVKAPHRVTVAEITQWLEELAK